MTTDTARRAAQVWVATVALITCACAASPTDTDEPPEAPALPAGIYAVDSGDEITRGDLFDRLAAKPYVVVGEAHDTEWHHRMQKTIFAALLERRPEAFALGMEMFHRSHQSALDAYAAAEIDEETMLERTKWAKNWGMDPALYRPLWQLAREKRAPIVALNVPRTITRAIARKGLEGLSTRQRAAIPETIDTGYPAQREYLKSVMGGGSHPGDMTFEYFLEAQATWDETMAETAVEFVRARKGTDAMMIVTGRAHARKAFGIPPRIVRRLEERVGATEADKRVVSLLPFSVGEKTPEGPVTLERLRKNAAADYVWVREE